MVSFLMKSAPMGWEDEYQFHTNKSKIVKHKREKISNMRKSLMHFSKSV
jgi:hypothetical protein